MAGIDDGGAGDAAAGPKLTPMERVEQTEKSFLKQPKVFLSTKKADKAKRPGKAGNRFWKSVGLGFKTPREAIEGFSAYAIKKLQQQEVEEMV